MRAVVMFFTCCCFYCFSCVFVNYVLIKCLQSFQAWSERAHLCVCIIFKITCETKSQVFRYAHTHTQTHTQPSEFRLLKEASACARSARCPCTIRTQLLVHAAHSLTLINDFPSPHIKFGHKKSETVAAFKAGAGQTRVPGCIHGYKIVVVH